VRTERFKNCTRSVDGDAGWWWNLDKLCRTGTPAGNLEVSHRVIDRRRAVSQSGSVERARGERSRRSDATVRLTTKHTANTQPSTEPLEGIRDELTDQRQNDASQGPAVVVRAGRRRRGRLRTLDNGSAEGLSLTKKAPTFQIPTR
jgi:hypothetical protein